MSETVRNVRNRRVYPQGGVTDDGEKQDPTVKRVIEERHTVCAKLLPPPHTHGNSRLISSFFANSETGGGVPSSETGVGNTP